MLVEDTTCTSQAMVAKVVRGMLEEAISKTFTSLVLKVKIQTSVRIVTLRGARGVLLTNNNDAKVGELVINVHWENYLAPVVPDVEVLEHYDVVPELVPLDVTEDTVELISGQLTGAAGPGGIDATGLQQWLLRFDIAS